MLNHIPRAIGRKSLAVLTVEATIAHEKNYVDEAPANQNDHADQHDDAQESIIHARPSPQEALTETVDDRFVVEHQKARDPVMLLHVSTGKGNAADHKGKQADQPDAAAQGFGDQHTRDVEHFAEGVREGTQRSRRIRIHDTRRTAIKASSSVAMALQTL
jgi:hypothetical protein